MLKQVSLAVLIAILVPFTASGQTLFQAVSGGGTAKALELIEAGADVNAATPGGTTALILAAETGHAEVVEALIAKGAGLNARNKTGMTALGLALDNGHDEIVRMLRDAGAAE